MSMLHLRVICPADLVDGVHDALIRHTGAVAVLVVGESSDGTEITADVARESVDDLLDALRELHVDEHGLISTEPLDTTIGALADRAERQAPGEGADALIWDELAARGREDSTLTGTFVAFMVLATLLASIGVVTNSPITIVGAMVVGPEFGPLAAIAVEVDAAQRGRCPARADRSRGRLPGSRSSWRRCWRWSPRRAGLIRASDLARTAAASTSSITRVGSR